MAASGFRKSSGGRGVHSGAAGRHSEGVLLVIAKNKRKSWEEKRKEKNSS